MGKYVAVGVLAVIILAAVTYESPGETETKTSESVSGSYGGESGTNDPIDEPAPPMTPRTPMEQRVDREAERKRQQLEKAKAVVIKHTVKKGESLRVIARKMLGDSKRWKELWERNKTRLPDPDQLRVGDVLEWTKQVGPGGKPILDTLAVSAPKTAKDVVVTSAGVQGVTLTKRPSPKGGKSVTVRKGDTLYAIARRELRSGKRWREIAELNGIDGSSLNVGQRLELPN